MAIDKKVLVIDDTDNLRGLYAAQLKGIGFSRVEQAKDGVDGIRKMLELATESNEKFDLVVTDWMMPGLNGLDLLKKLQENEHLQDIPILFITGAGSAQVVGEAVIEGAADFLFKPFSIEDLKEKAFEILELET